MGYETLDNENGHILAKFWGEGVGKAFRNEPGKHVIQRISPTERNGRKHTSVVSVAVLPLPPVEKKDQLPEKDLEITYQTGKQKAGGQNVNRVHSAVRMKHIPTGVSVFINGRDQGQNRKEALNILTVKVNDHFNNQKAAAYDSFREKQMKGNGTKVGGRGDKTRTYNILENRIVDHRLGVKTSNIKEIFKGNLSILFNQIE